MRNELKWLALVFAATLVGSGCTADVGEAGSSSAALEHGHDDGGHGDHGPCNPGPVMLSGDFDGDGVIGSGDIEMISAYVEADDYAAFFDMTADGVLDGRDVSAVARRMGEDAHPRDAQMAELWTSVEPYRYTVGGGFQPFTPELRGHGIHYANMSRVWGWSGFDPGAPEGLNYVVGPDGLELVAAFYYAPAAYDVSDYDPSYPQDTYYQTLPAPHSFHGVHGDMWHQHIGACFGSPYTTLPGFDQCVTEADCVAMGGTLWADMFHMLHVWLFEHNECGPFAGIDEDVSAHAPAEPNHNACTLDDLVPVVL